MSVCYKKLCKERRAMGTFGWIKQNRTYSDFLSHRLRKCRTECSLPIKISFSEHFTPSFIKYSYLRAETLHSFYRMLPIADWRVTSVYCICSSYTFRYIFLQIRIGQVRAPSQFRRRFQRNWSDGWYYDSEPQECYKQECYWYCIVTHLINGRDNIFHCCTVARRWRESEESVLTKWLGPIGSTSFTTCLKELHHVDWQHQPWLTGCYWELGRNFHQAFDYMEQLTLFHWTKFYKINILAISQKYKLLAFVLRWAYDNNMQILPAAYNILHSLSAECNSNR